MGSLASPSFLLPYFPLIYKDRLPLWMALKLEAHTSSLLHPCYKGLLGWPISQMNRLRLKQSVILSTSSGPTNSSNVPLQFILQTVCIPNDFQSLKPKDCLHCASTTPGLAEGQLSLGTAPPASFRRDPLGSSFLWIRGGVKPEVSTHTSLWFFSNPWQTAL